MASSENISEKLSKQIHYHNKVKSPLKASEVESVRGDIDDIDLPEDDRGKKKSRKLHKA